MWPEWISLDLKELGLPGAIIVVLLMAVGSLVGYIRSLLKKEDKIYGYRLAERDTLNKALTDAATVLRDMLAVTRERNDLTEQQADLLAKQVTAFELLKVMIVSQYENIKDNNAAVSQSVHAMAESIRVLTSMVSENKMSYGFMLGELKSMITTTSQDLKSSINQGTQTVCNDIRAQLGSGGNLTIVQRKRTIHNTRPKGGQS